MESAEARKIAREIWLTETCRLQGRLVPLVADASFRRYFRLATKDATFVVMDAPPQRENCRPFVAVSAALRALGLHAPDVILADLTQGFLLLTDFGDQTYLRTLTRENADHLYGNALDALVILQSCPAVPNHTLPVFDAAFMQQEWIWYKEWFLEKLLGLQATTDVDHAYAYLAKIIDEQPRVFMHRDFHAANLMVIDSGQAVGILDFQDAFIGPVTYDVASLLRDCYIDWPPEKVTAWALSYWQRLQKAGVLATVDSATFLCWFDCMGMQRHLKALMTFARKHVRDGDSTYLSHVPRTLNYLTTISSRYAELNVLHDFLITHVQPALTQKVSACAQ